MEMVGAVKSWSISGDWFVKSDESVERRMAALQSIIRSYSRKEIVLEQRVLEREVVVVSGDWNFKQLEVGPYISIAGAVALYDSDNDLNTGGSSRTGSLKDLFEILESWLMLRVVDEVKGVRPQQVAFKTFFAGRSTAMGEESRLRILGNLEEQTGLKFTRMKRPVPVWIVEEGGTSTRAAPAR